MPGSRNFTIRTPLQKVSQTTDGTRPPGLTTAVPVRLSQDFGGKTSGTFRTNPTSAAIVRRKNHDGLQSFLTGDWSAIFGQEVYGGSAVDTLTGELTTPQYTAIGTVDGANAQVDARLVSAPCVTDTNCLVLSTKLSRDGLYTYSLSAASTSGSACVYFNIINNLTGTQMLPTLGGVPLPAGKIDLTASVVNILAADGNIAVVDDSTSQDAAHNMAYNSALFAFQVVGRNLLSAYNISTLVYRYDFAANNIDVLDAGHTINSSVAVPTYVPRAFANVQLVVQAQGTLVAIVVYRATFTAGPPDSGTILFAKLTIWTAGGAPSSAIRAISGNPVVDFSSPPTTAVSRRGSIGTSRKFYLYYFLSAIAEIVWYVIDPNTFWAAGGQDQLVTTTAHTPAGTTYAGMKAAPLPSTFLNGGNPCMAVTFIYKNTTTNQTAIKVFVHTTSASADVIGNSWSLDSLAGIASIFEIGIGVCVDAAGDQARFVVPHNSPRGGYTYYEIRCTDMTNLSALSFGGGVFVASPTNATLNAIPAGLTANRFAFAMSMWNDNAGPFNINKNDIQAITYLKSDQSAVNMRVVAPFVAIGLVWDADLYENLPNPNDPSTNQRVTTFYATGTGANDSGYVPGAMLAGFRTTPGYNPIGDGSNAADLTAPFSPTLASPDTIANAALEISPAYVYPASGVVVFAATMNDEFTFTVSSWGSQQLPGQIAVGMTLVLTAPAFAVGRYTISGVSYDPVAEATTKFTVSQRVPFFSAAFLPTHYTGYVTVGPSTSIRQLILPTAANGGNNRQGNVIYPSIVHLDYVKIATLATNSEICELTAPTRYGVAPVGVQVHLRGYNLNNSTIPNDPAAGIEVSLSLDDGVTWVTKVLSTTGTSSVTGTTGFSSFGVQSFSGGWYPIPALIKEGDFLFVYSGPNAGMYSISGLQPSIGPELYVDRPFPFPGDPSVVNFIICSAKDEYQDDGIGGAGYGLLGMNFDLSGLPFTSSVIHVRVECKDQIASGPNTYEFDSITVQWTP
jgi:hypothetical protein